MGRASAPQILFQNTRSNKMNEYYEPKQVVAYEYYDVGVIFECYGGKGMKVGNLSQYLVKN